MKYVYVPSYIKTGITYKSTSFPSDVRIFGADTETCRGDVEMIQVCDGTKVDLIHVNPKDALQKFIEYMDKVCHKDIMNLCFFHNLTFDMEVMLLPYAEVYLKQKTFNIKIGNFLLKMFMGKTPFVDVIFSKNRRLYIRDSSKFISGSLKSVAQKLNLPHKKMDRPVGLGERSPWNKDICRYAIEDAWVTYDIGQWLVSNLFKKYDIGLCVSYSQFAQKYYQANFIEKDEVIPFPPDDASFFAEASYRGGKNGLYISAPIIVDDCYEIDMVSAYAYSLTQMPKAFFSKYQYLDHYEYNTHAIYCIDGNIASMKYPLLFDDKFKPVVGEFKNLYVTSYELDKAMDLGVINLTKCRGWKLLESNYIRHSFKDFVNFWWNKKKHTQKGTVEYKHTKLASNAIYGKLIGRVELDSIDYIQKRGEISPVEYTYRACSFYNPFLASLVTAKTRLRLWDLETKYKAIHSATDSVKSVIHPDKSDATGSLGGVAEEVYGKCILLRNKLYVHYDRQGQIQKFALHGFWGTVDQLLDMLEKNITSYKYQHMPKFREAFRQVNKKVVPFYMREFERYIRLNLNEWWYLKGDRLSSLSPNEKNDKLNPTL